MMDWLRGRKVTVVGTHPAIETALMKAGARVVNDAPSNIFIHIAAAPTFTPALEMSHAQWRQSLDAGLDQRFLQANAYANECRTRGEGGVVLFVGAPEQALGSDQAAAAGALGNLTKTLGVEWARDGIRVNTILTHRTDEGVGTLAAYLVSDYTAYVTGAVVGLDEND